jgi:hypothetical protein
MRPWPYVGVGTDHPGGGNCIQNHACDRGGTVESIHGDVDSVSDEC